ncbi:MAG: DUF4190 domain-containing protein [bacterium]|nr:DUF4190 domain-containing protein [bacterium]
MTDQTATRPAPAGTAAPAAEPQQGDSTGGIIPYKNPPALTAYYCGIFSLMPFIGIFLGIPALILGIVGLKKKKANPVISGTVHAWVGIIMGGLTTLLWGGLMGLAFFGMMMSE